MPAYNLRVNGRRHAVDVAAEMPLLWVLRDHLDLRGAKYGCGRGFCGACTVHLDGSAVQSCLLPVSATAEREITTIEGLGAAGGGEVQQAWVEAGVAQCGYCQAGQIMKAAALLDASPAPDEDEIDDAMSSNLCRCGTYLRIRRAIQRASELRGGGSR